MEEWIPNATASTTYQPSRIQYGAQAPSSANTIHVVASQSSDVWLGLGDRAVLHLDGKEVEIGYFPRRVMLPFPLLRLNRFTVEHDPGTLSPAAYSSQVSVSSHEKTPRDVTISMNEPLQLGTFTLYQASYEDGTPRPITSIFSSIAIQDDFGSTGGSLSIVLGSISLFALKYRGKRNQKRSFPEFPSRCIYSFGGFINESFFGKDLSSLSRVNPSTTATLDWCPSAEAADAPLAVASKSWSFVTLGLTPVQSGGRIKPLAFLRERDSFSLKPGLEPTGIGIRLI